MHITNLIKFLETPGYRQAIKFYECLSNYVSFNLFHTGCIIIENHNNVIHQILALNTKWRILSCNNNNLHESIKNIQGIGFCRVGGCLVIISNIPINAGELLQHISPYTIKIICSNYNILPEYQPTEIFRSDDTVFLWVFK